jgi:hypothetical protein
LSWEDTFFGASGALAFVSNIWVVADALSDAVALGVEMKAHRPFPENMVGEQAGSGSPFGRSLQWKKYPMTLTPPTQTRN